jgi:hypothetical protein
MTTLADPIVSSLDDFRSGKPGVYERIPADEYHKLRAVSSTALKRLYCDTPKHALAVLDNPDVGSDELNIGGAAHAILLRPEEFDESYTCADQCSATVKSTGARCGNDGKILDCGAWYCGVHGKGLPNQAAGTVLTPDNYRRVRGIHDAVWRNETARTLLRGADDKELSVLWVEEDDEVAILCKARFDLVCRSMGVLPDLKTCRSVNPKFFTKQAWQLGYHLQLAHYLHGGAVAGVAVDLPTILAVENDEPFDCVVFKPSVRFMQRGIEARREAIKTLLRCELTGIWPGHGDRPVSLDVPEWEQ